MSIEGYRVEPPRPDTRSNCLKVAGISCLVVVVVVIALFYWVYSVTRNSPAMRRIFSTVESMSQCQTHLQEISGALDRYSSRNGKYPAKLGDLYPSFLENRTALHCPADPRAERVVSYEYTRPEMDAQGTTVVVRCRRHILMPGQPPVTMVLYKDGRIVTEGMGTVAPTQPSPQPESPPSPPPPDGRGGRTSRDGLTALGPSDILGWL